VELIDQSGGALEQKRASAELYFSTERAFRILDSAAKMVRDTRLPTDV
jgi:hypothetical protein